MGSVLSTLRNYFWTKVDNAKSAVKNKVNCCKDAVVTKVTDTKTAVVTRVNHLATTVVTGVRSTRDDVVGSIVEKKNRVCDRINAFRNAVCETVTNCKNKAVTQVNNVVTTVVNAKNAVVTKVVNTKNAIIQKYVDAKTCIYQKYRSVREARLTRWQKAKYGSLAAVLVVMLLILFLTLLDIYLGDYDSARERLEGVWYIVCMTAENIWLATNFTLTYLCYGLRCCLDNIWHGTKLAASYFLIGCQELGHYLYVGGGIAAEQIAHGTSIAAQYFWMGTKNVAHYMWLGTQYGAFYGYKGGQVAVEYLVHAGRLTADCVASGAATGFEWAKHGSIVAADYTGRAAVYTYEHGSVALKEGSVRFYHYAIYFVTNFREASAEAVVWSWEMLKVAAVAFVSWSYSGSILLFQLLCQIILYTFNGTIAFCVWTYQSALASYEWTVSTVEAVTLWTKTMSLEGYDLICHLVTVCYSAVVSTCSFIYISGITCFDFVVHWSCVSAEFISSWTVYIAQTVSHGLYIGLNKYALRWLGAIGVKVWEFSSILGNILLKFFLDLGVYVGNFLYVTFNHVYAVLYVLFAFLYHLLSGIGAVIKVVVRGAVFCTTTVFRAIIWVMEETVFAYMYMLHKYNMYREILFIVFIGFLSLYCTGVMRDRRHHDETDADEESEDDEELDEHDKEEGEEHKEHEHVEGPSKELKRRKVSKRALEVRRSRKKHLMPSHEDVDSSDDDLLDFGGLEDKLETEEDFLPEQDVPDCMDNLDARIKSDS